MRMPFGKHRGQELEDIPADYLAWILDNVDLDNRPTLRLLIKQRLGITNGSHAGTDSSSGPSSGLPDLRGTVRDWYRGLAFDYHPDRRKGSDEAMKAINEAYDRLRKALKLD